MVQPEGRKTEIVYFWSLQEDHLYHQRSSKGADLMRRCRTWLIQVPERQLQNIRSHLSIVSRYTYFCFNL
jgi:hypothetical protein